MAQHFLPDDCRSSWELLVNADSVGVRGGSFGVGLAANKIRDDGRKQGVRPFSAKELTMRMQLWHEGLDDLPDPMLMDLAAASSDVPSAFAAAAPVLAAWRADPASPLLFPPVEELPDLWRRYKEYVLAISRLAGLSPGDGDGILAEPVPQQIAKALSPHAGPSPPRSPPAGRSRSRSREALTPSDETLRHGAAPRGISRGPGRGAGTP